MKLSLIISTLTCGGAERVLTLLANEWVRRGHEVELTTLDREAPFFPLDARVRLVQLDCERPSPTPLHALWNLGRSVSAIRGALKRFGPDAVIAFTTRVNVKVLMAARPLRIPVIISERTNPEVYELPSSWRRLVNRHYPSAAKLVVQTERIREHFSGRGLQRLAVIPNPVEAPRLAPRTPHDPPLLWLAVSRLGHEKGVDLLLRAWAASRQSRENRLRVLGDGPERASLEALAAELGIAANVEFAGFVAEKDAHWQAADAFVLPSRFEGFPNALCEALAAGLPCVSFDCPTGPRELIEPGRNGLLVPAEDVEALARALDTLSGDAELRRRLAQEAPGILDALGLSGIVDRWEEVLGWRVP